MSCLVPFSSAIRATPEAVWGALGTDTSLFAKLHESGLAFVHLFLPPSRRHVVTGCELVKLNAIRRFSRIEVFCEDSPTPSNMLLLDINVVKC